ncbi:MAG: hypothetical protein CL670_11705 [Balneola sp.]|jgi:hypothetical protein|nr:hypothetical protein [Balneola sp.]MBE79812.1 hypothetical protein [Balneola sp.]HBX65322.1 hypothetical protein [Balneolaceae bacterium]|tara:strand:+ start:1653 stop:2228 length:576 start_codon:yes stop_codon:yes gene_type:complete
MKSLLLLLFLFTASIIPAFAQYEYEPSEAHPYGQLNPDAPEQVGDFAPLIGKSECSSESRAQDGSWNEPVDMYWIFKYIMNGKAVQDETLKADGAHSGSIRQFNADSLKWYVHYYASGSIPSRLPAWEGTKTEKESISFYRDQASPNGNEGYFRLTFSEITDNQFNWVGEWTDKAETFSYPTWKISCTKIE